MDQPYEDLIDNLRDSSSMFVNSSTALMQGRGNETGTYDDIIFRKVESNDIDMRRIRAGAQAMLFSSYSVDRTLGKVYKVKLSVGNRENTANSIFEVNGPPTLSRTQTAFNIVGNQFDSESDIHPVSDEGKFILLCWDVFRSHLENQLSISKGPKLRIAMTRMKDSIAQLCPHLSEDACRRIRDQISFTDESYIIWDDFKNAALVFIYPHFNFPGRVSAPKLKQFSSLATSSNNSSHPYHAMERKFQESMSLPRPSSIPAIEQSSTTMLDLNGEKVSLGAFHEASTSLFKQEHRTDRQECTGSGVKQEVSGFLHGLTEDRPHFTSHMQKHNVNDMFQPQHSFAAKWERMKKQRDQRHLREEKNKARNQMLEALNRNAIKADKYAVVSLIVLLIDE